MKVLSGKLNDYDLLLASPLFNYGNSPVLPGSDRQAYQKFLNDGGMIAITDGTYSAVRAWVADLDPAFTGLEEGKCTSSQWAVWVQRWTLNPCITSLFSLENYRA